jgi:hypothetical protein
MNFNDANLEEQKYLASGNEGKVKGTHHETEGDTTNREDYEDPFDEYAEAFERYLESRLGL